MKESEDLDFDINLDSPAKSKDPNSQSIPINDTENKKIAPKEQKPKQVSSSEKIDFTNFLSHAKNPGIVFFTLFFKVLAMVFFLFLGIFGVPDALIFIFVVILNSLDFWFVKNISGRILVGLRWWNEVKEDGSEEWKFESSHEIKARSIDTTIFWMSLYIAPGFWGIFMILELIGFILTFSNTYGYYRCSKDQNKKIEGFLKDKTHEGFAKIMQFGVNAFANSNK